MKGFPHTTFFGQQVNLYVQCPNIEASMYAQCKLRDVFGFQILNGNNEPHFTDRFCIVNPPEEYKHEMPVICSCKTSVDREGNLSDEDKYTEFVPMLEALQLINLVHEKKK